MNPKRKRQRIMHEMSEYSSSSMADLPFELLIKIFKSLSPADRRSFRLVSRRFKETSEFFQSDYRLLLSNCKVSTKTEPGRLFLKSNLKFHALTFNDVVTVGRAKADKDIWIQLGEQVKAISFMENFFNSSKFYDYNFEDTINYFKNIRKVEYFVKSLSLEPLHFLSTLIENGTFNAVESFTFKYDFQHEFSVLEWNEIKKIFTDLPNLKELNVSFYNKNHYNEDAVLQILQTHASKIRFLDYNEGTLVMKNDRIDDLNLDSINFRYYDDRVEKIKEFLESQPNVKEMRILSKTIPSVFPEKIKGLVLYLKRDEDFQRFTELANFIHLEDLEFNINHKGGQNCFFTHELCMNTSVKKLKVNLNHITCFICVNSLTKSFPNVQSLHLENANDTMQNLIIRDMTGLQELVITSDFFLSVSVHQLCALTNLKILDFHGSFMGENLSQLSSMPNLREFGFCYESHTSAGTKNLIESCPNIEVLKLYKGSEINDGMIKLISQGFKQLKNLHLFNCTKLTQKSWTYMANIKSLRLLEVRNIAATTEDFIPELFKNSSLRVIKYDKNIIIGTSTATQRKWFLEAAKPKQSLHSMDDSDLIFDLEMDETIFSNSSSSESEISSDEEVDYHFYDTDYSSDDDFDLF